MKLITTTEDLAAFCKPLADTEFVTVDTEFMRERTYWPKLCLAQVAGPDDAAAIDALADGIDLAPLDELMANPKVLKVFHAARQDLEIFYLRMNKVPQPLFDTQVAAMVCGHGEAASYESLASKLAKAKIDKSSRFTDWSRRPLSERQITYALSDVTHLRVVYEKLRRQLEKSGRLPWIAEEMAVLNDPATYRAEKHRVAEAVIDLFEKRVPAVRAAIEVVDVSTPASVYRYTGNWKGSMEGWLIMPGAGFKPLPNTLPGLRRFLMVGQWVMPGGGLPSGLMTARSALKAVCKEDRVPFDLQARDTEKPESVAV